MRLFHTRRLAAAGCLALLLCLSIAGCGDEPGASGGMAGAAGAGGVAGEGGMGGAPPPPEPQLWEGQSRGVKVCFNLACDRSRLQASPDCGLSGESGSSFDLDVELVGVDQDGQPCSFGLRYEDPVTIDQDTNSFRASAIQMAGSDALYSFSGEIVGMFASGIARQDLGDSNCRVGWAASPSGPCDDELIDYCLVLLDCCASILVNPVFFQTCDSIVQQGDQTRCTEVLAGYPQCEPDAEP